MLDRLAELYGIGLRHWEIGGVERIVPDDTKRALLRAMGVGLDAMAEEVERAEAAPWLPALPATTVLRGNQALPVVLPADEATRLRLTLSSEAGRAETVERLARDLPLLGAAEVRGVRRAHRAVALPDGLGTGYFRLVLEAGGGWSEGLLARTPGHCVAPPVERLWGVAAQLYGLRSARNLGMGDLTDLAELAERAAREGAGMVGVNPLHALYPGAPAHACPYAPSSRLFLDTLLIDPEAEPEFAAPAVQAVAGQVGWEALRAHGQTAELVDRVAVAGAKLPVLRTMFELFRAVELAGAPPGPRGTDFLTFRAARGGLLERHCLFDALDVHFAAAGERLFWTAWPEGFARPDAPEALAFAARNPERVTFFAWLQWLADRQLAAAQARAISAGARLGLYCDLAVGDDPHGAAVWAEPELYARGVAVGAPPDPFSPHGQNWGLAPLRPAALGEAGFAPWLAGLQSAMRHAGAVRIDHAMGLQRLFWIPDGAPGEAGAYVRYPFDDFLGLLALESHRQDCVVIGEDLGTVSEGFRERLHDEAILAYRVLWFEREDGRFRPPAAYPDQALVTVSTHDLPTLAGFWSANDVSWRARALQMEPDGAALVGRAAEVRALLHALAACGLLPEGVDPDHPPDAPDAALAAAIHRFLARTPCRLMLAQAEDLEGGREQANLPGTVDAHPNWTRRLATPTNALFDLPLARAIVAAIRAER